MKLLFQEIVKWGYLPLMSVFGRQLCLFHLKCQKPYLAHSIITCSFVLDLNIYPSIFLCICVHWLIVIDSFQFLCSNFTGFIVILSNLVLPHHVSVDLVSILLVYLERSMASYPNYISIIHVYPLDLILLLFLRNYNREIFYHRTINFA